MPARRPPPPTPDDPVPPPVPSRPEAKKTGNKVVNNQPAIPDSNPPALPQRPSRTHQPVMIQQDELLYEPIGTPPAPTDVPLAQRPPQPLPVQSCPNDLLQEEEDQEDYVVPLPMNQGQNCSSNQAIGLPLNTIQQRRLGVDPREDYDTQIWSDSEWSDHEDMSTQAEEDGGVYEDPQELPPETPEDTYLQADPISPKALVPPALKSNVPMLSLNPADLHIGRNKLTNTAQAKSPTSKTNHTERAPTSIDSIKKAFEQTTQPSSNSKPTPPPKPKPGKTNLQTSAITPIVTPPKFNNTHGASNITDNSDKDTKTDSRYDDNSSSESVSSGSGGGHSSKKGSSTIPKSGVQVLPLKGPRPRLKSHNSTDKSEDDKPSKLSPLTPPLTPLKPAVVVEAKSPPPAELESSNDIYDQGMSETNGMHPWFHDDIDRNEGERRIATIGEVGTFLIRTSSHPTKPNEEKYPYTLVVQATKDKVKTLRLRQRHDGNYAIGTSKKADELSFSTLEKLVEYHRSNNVRIFENNTEYVVKLVQTPKKS